jgi:hypothetical protein
MKTLKNHLSAIACVLISVVAIYNSHTAMLLAGQTGTIYVEAVSSEAYQTMSQVFNNTQPAAF